MSLEPTRNKIDIFIASGVSSIISTLLTNPIEVAKLHIQYYPLTCPSYPHQNYQNFTACSCSKISMAGTLKSLKIALPQTVLMNIGYMQLYQQSRQYLLRKLQVDSAIGTLIAAFGSRFVVTTLNLPLQSSRVKLSNQIDVLSITKNFHGYRITLLRDLVYSGLFWSMLEGYRNNFSNQQYRQMVRKNEFNIDHFWINFAPGLIFGALTSAITTPLDILKTRVQSQGLKTYSIFQDLGKIYKNQKLFSLFSGVGYRMSKNAIHTSMYLMMYQWLLNRIRKEDGYIL